MTNLDMAAGAPAVAARRLSGLRQASLGALVMLIVQFGLGIGVNLYITLPAKGSAGDAFSNGPLLVLHVLVGLLLVVTAIGLLVRAIIARHGPVIVAAAVGLVAIAAAATQGFSFVSDGTNAASLAMALATGVAMLCYVIALYLVRPPAQRS
jgi:hypothetical protein